MKILETKYRNFRAHRSLEIEPNGQDINVYGDNGTGKTSLADGQFWLLFGKDSLGRADFPVKTQDGNGDVIHNLEHSVYTKFLMEDGSTLELERTLSEDWVKNRASEVAQLEGHKTVFKINGVPQSKTHYERWLMGIADESVFRMLMDPNYFTRVMKWQDRRALLLKVCGDISDTAVIDKHPKLAPLAKILAGKTVADYTKILKSKRPEVSKEMDALPGRIDEVNRQLQGEHESFDEAKWTAAREKRDAAAKKREDLKVSGPSAASQRQLVIKEGKLQEVVNRLSRQKNIESANIGDRVRQVNNDLQDAQAKADRLNHFIAEDKKALPKCDAQIEELREKWRTVKKGTFEAPTADTTYCPTCGQPLPEEELLTHLEKAIAIFNQEKAATLEKITAEGKEWSEKRRTIELRILEREELAAALDTSITDLTKDLAIAKDVQAAHEAEKVDYEADAEYLAVKGEIEELKLSIADGDGGLTKQLEKIDQEIGRLDVMLDEMRQLQAADDHRKRQEDRLAELSKLQKKLAGELEKIDHEMFLCQEFVRLKVKTLTDSINSRFQFARFNLFEEQLNGGLQEICDVTYLGLPPSHGQSVRLGLDIIETLSEHYKFAPPIIIDNAESVTDILPTTGQQIRNFVSKKDKKLRLELSA